MALVIPPKVCIDIPFSAFKSFELSSVSTSALQAALSNNRNHAVNQISAVTSAWEKSLSAVKRRVGSLKEFPSTAGVYT